MSDLFGTPPLGEKPSGLQNEDGDVHRPLADRLRPRHLNEVMGQDHLLSQDAPLGRMVALGKVSSLILWGPPGTGKTTIARLLADVGGFAFVQISAILSGVADLKKIFEAASLQKRAGRSTLLFVDEIHRFNRSQQDSFLPHVEDGTITLVGATTENPSFEINGALLSRMQVLVLHRLDAAALDALLVRAEQLMERPLPVQDGARAALLAMADGDGRYLLNCAEALFDLAGEEPVDEAGLARLLQRRAPAHDKDREGHYNLASALHKSLRGSDADAALYWLARALVGGEDPKFILRRLVRFASEDVGLADPQALVQALAAKDAYQF
ncbi:hypothetical protein JCM17845_25930 [Iodidimonas gelatinilytica]|nr:hypothetical protein JCM17845_25930 [Iodidimonas gelatinilytica]